MTAVHFPTNTEIGQMTLTELQQNYNLFNDIRQKATITLNQTNDSSQIVRLRNLINRCDNILDTIEEEEDQRAEDEEEEEETKGAGIMDVLRNPIGTLREAFRTVPSKLNNGTTKVLNDVGNVPITAIEILKSRVNPKLEATINILSMGKFNQLKQQNNIETFFHLALAVTLQNGQQYIMEKNEVIEVQPYTNKYPDAQRMSIMQIPPDLTMNQLLDGALKLMGPTRFYDYQAFGGQGGSNNCQDFVLAMIDSANMQNKFIYRFAKQDLSGLNKGFANSAFSAIPTVVKGITRMGSFMSRIIGKGKKKKLTKKEAKEFESILKKTGLTQQQFNKIAEHLLNMITQHEFRFI